MGWKIVAFCEVPRSIAEIMGKLGLTHRTFFRRPSEQDDLFDKSHEVQPR